MRREATLFVLCLVATFAFAKDKNKSVLPAYVLEAHTVAVIIDPSAGISVDDPRANEVARKDVETALLNWGRFTPLVSVKGADLVIVIRKGHGKLVDDTITAPPPNNRPGAITPINNGIAVGAQH